MNGIQNAKGQPGIPGGPNITSGNMSMPSFNKGKSSVHHQDDSIEFNEKTVSGNTSINNNLRGAGSTISKAGELIMQ